LGLSPSGPCVCFVFVAKWDIRLKGVPIIGLVFL
jgi:hypothetical protein